MICFAMAKRALIVGDTMQLEPVWNIPPHIDALKQAQFGLARMEQVESLVKLSKNGTACSSGSVMKRAIANCRWSDQGSQGSTSVGVFLSEHRRSVPSIVRFCNELAYHGRLEPKRGNLTSSPLPAFAWGFVAGNDQREGTSRKNTTEVAAIKDWLEKREESLRQAYNQRPLEEILAVVTPFAAQKRALQKALRPRWPEMTIGTVNALQGAEREIIVFSPTYDKSFSGSYFFNRDANMLNVAVSRAKDSFVVIGDTSIFVQGTDPVGILARHLFSDPANELPDVVAP
jgi:superfamily I DNA and/or RNA helicase